MIVIFEGPQGVGKTSIINELMGELKRRDLPVEQWKVTRGTDPIADMNASLDTEFKEKKIYILDRFHLSEWAIDRGTRRNWVTDPEWKLIESQLRIIDDRLRRMGTLLFCITASTYFVDKRLAKLGKTDVLGDSQNSAYWWRFSVQNTRIDCVHLINNDFYQLHRNVLIIADLIDIRWSDAMMSGAKDDLKAFAADLGAIEGTEEGETPTD